MWKPTLVMRVRDRGPEIVSRDQIMSLQKRVDLRISGQGSYFMAVVMVGRTLISDGCGILFWLRSLKLG